MNRKKKLIVYSTLVLVVIIVAFVLFRTFINNKYISRIPEVPENNLVTVPVKEQIVEANKNAKRNPSAKNLGKLGMVYHSSANYKQAEQCYKLAIERSKSDWYWNYYNGYLNIEMGNPKEAIKSFNQVIEKNPEIKTSWFYLGGEYKNLGKNDLAEKSYNEISNELNSNIQVSSKTRRDHFPLAVYARYELARIHFDSGRVDEAEDMLEDIIQRFYLFGPAYRLLGSVYNMKGDEQLAKKYTVRANDLVLYSPPVDTLIDKLVLLSRSELYLLKRIDEAERTVYADWTLQLVNHGMQYLPDNKYMISKAIKTYLWKMQENKAKALIDKHISLYEGNFSEMNKTGMLFFRKQIFPEALKYFTEALKIEPDDIETQQNLAKCYMAFGNREKSHEILDEIYKNNAHNPEVQAEVIYLMNNFGKKEKAVEYLKEVNRKVPSNPNVLKLSADLASKKGNIAEAISKYESSLKLNPGDLLTVRKLGNILFKQKEWKKYETLYKQSLEVYPNDPELLERLGTYLIDCPDTLYKNIPEGKEYVERAFTYYDCPPDILLSAGSHLAFAYAFLGDKQKAVTTISQTINIAKGQNVSDSYMKMLENFYRTFRNM